MASRAVLIFFIPGNPGLIHYYQPFLSSLSRLLDSCQTLRSVQFHIYGQNLAGFDDSDHEPFSTWRPPHDLEYVIQDMRKSVSELRIVTGPRKGEPFDEVVLIGHSVGSYIALQVFHRLLRNPETAPRLQLKAGILLFPTIEHIAKSRSGARLDFVRRTPFLRSNAHGIAKALLWVWPYDVLWWLISKTLGFPDHATTVTTRFLTSRDGVWQSLYLGMNEMEVIGEDKWDEKLWLVADEARTQHKPVPKFFFCYAKNDGWVADHVRDAFIERRQKKGKAEIHVDEGNNIPHAFCLSRSCPLRTVGRGRPADSRIGHSEVVADKVTVWINQLYGTE